MEWIWGSFAVDLWFFYSERNKFNEDGANPNTNQLTWKTATYEVTRVLNQTLPL